MHEYLLHAGRLRRLRGDALARAVDRVIGRCDLGAVRGRRVEALSKGYRQRVGLAQAMVHEPDVLLLDEPGSGFDPQQTEALRTLVREHARERCVVFSTHLLHEARSVCTRVAVVHEGRLVAERPADGAELDALFDRLARGEPVGDAADGVAGGPNEPRGGAADRAEAPPSGGPGNGAGARGEPRT